MKLSARPSTVTTFAAAALIAFALMPSKAQAQASALAEDPFADRSTTAQCAAGGDRIESRSVLVHFDQLRLPADAPNLNITLYDGDRELFTESYSIMPFERTDRSAVELWLGGINSPGNATWSFGDDLRSFFIEVNVDGVVTRQLGLSELFSGDETLRSLPTEIVPVSAIEHISVEPKPVDAESLLFAKSTFVCPNAIPNCDYEYDACENDCYDAGSNVSGACLQACNDQFLDCYYGEPVNRIVLTPVQKQRDGFSCRQKNCDGAPRTIEDWQYKERKRTYQSTYCRTTGQTYNETLISSVVLPTVKFCNKDQPVILCPFGQVSTGCYTNSDLCPF